MNKERKMKKTWLHTQNSRRFPGFAVVVEKNFDENIDDFQLMFENCVFVKKKTNNPFWGLTVFQKKKCFLDVPVS